MLDGSQWSDGATNWRFGADPTQCFPTLTLMKTEEARERAAASLRALSHTFAAHDPADDALASIAETANELTLSVSEAPMRDRLALMRSSRVGSILGGSGFEDRAVGGCSNPTSVELEVRFEGDEVIADVVLRRAFEGAPGRAHGGIVAAAFDDVTGIRDRQTAGAGLHGRVDGSLSRSGARGRSIGNSSAT